VSNRAHDDRRIEKGREFVGANRPYLYGVVKCWMHTHAGRTP